jgi:hypothetical protein
MQKFIKKLNIFKNLFKSKFFRFLVLFLVPLVFVFSFIRLNLIVERIITPDKVGNTNFRILPNAEGLIFIEDLSKEIQKGVKENNLITALLGLPAISSLMMMYVIVLLFTWIGILSLLKKMHVFVYFG